MKLLLVLALLIPQASLAYFAEDYERPLRLYERDMRGTLIDDVIRIQKRLNGNYNQRAVDRNMTQLRKLIVCSRTPTQCVNRIALHLR